MTRSKVRGRVFLQAWVTPAQAKQIELFLAGYDKGVRAILAAQRLTAARRRQLEAEIDELAAMKKNEAIVAVSEAEAQGAPSMRLDAKTVAKLISLSVRQVCHLAQLGRIPGAELENTPRGPVWRFRRKPRVLPAPRPPGRPKGIGK